MQVIIDSPIRYKGVRYEEGVIEIDDEAVQPLLTAKAVRAIAPNPEPPVPEKTVSTRKKPDAPTA